MRDAYEECLRVAARCARNRDEARDLLQTVFLHALERGASDVGTPERRAFLRGALRRRAAFEARLAVRRRRREARWADARAVTGPASPLWRFSAEFLAQLARVVHPRDVLRGPAEGNLCAIGDPDQAIYGFRGADVGFFLRFAHDFPEARQVALTRKV